MRFSVKSLLEFPKLVSVPSHKNGTGVLLAPGHLHIGSITGFKISNVGLCVTWDSSETEGKAALSPEQP